MPKKKSATPGGEGAGKEDKKKNPALKKARNKYAKKLKAEGVAENDRQEKVKTYMKETVRPAFEEARTAAKAKDLKGKEKQAFIERTLGEKLNWAS